jgi:hypothetical protein
MGGSLMIASASEWIDLGRLGLTGEDLQRGLVAGVAWAMLLTAGLTALSAWEYGGICVPELFVTAGLSLVGGIVAIGPVAAYGRR